VLVHGWGIELGTHVAGCEGNKSAAWAFNGVAVGGGGGGLLGSSSDR